jgi:hypothetical protein
MLTLLLACSMAAEPKGSSLELSNGWKATSEMKSEYAVQAAAADGKYAYAVSSTHVARYDRTTGERLGLATTPDTKHLNSAFVWKGKVYCAHSNYPKLPEASDIRVYDPAKDTLAVFHTFNEPVGSLVWCVRDPNDAAWWCCFAKYGKEKNAGTLLLKMDDEFKELARWTFPKNVVDDWDGMSASGAIWDGDSLLVSHHHFKVLYRVRLPKQGTELEFVRAHRCPFPGQGIAADPQVKGGLVGIDRGKKAILFAELEK